MGIRGEKELSRNRFYNTDCVSGSREHLADNSVDLIITDPPYGIDGGGFDKHYNRDESFVVDGYVDIPSSEYKGFSLEWIKEAERILRPGGSLFVVSGYTNLHHILNALHATDLKEINHLIWKFNFGVYTKKKFISSHYHILFWQKPCGDATFNTFCRFGDSEKDDGSSMNYLDREDVFVINKENKQGETRTVNELPYELLIKIIQYCSNPGDTVCDMFLGGFSTAIVAKGLMRNAVGFEISEKPFELGMERFNAAEEGFLMNCLRRPEQNRKPNSGKTWTAEERDRLESMFWDNIDHNKSEIIETIGRSMGRGRWSIDRELEKKGLWEEKWKHNKARSLEKKRMKALKDPSIPPKKRGRPPKNAPKDASDRIRP
jgi:site-specific DNA-methyltransferase (adenine-specific)